MRGPSADSAGLMAYKFQMSDLCEGSAVPGTMRCAECLYHNPVQMSALKEYSWMRGPERRSRDIRLHGEEICHPNVQTWAVEAGQSWLQHRVILSSHVRDAYLRKVGALAEDAPCNAIIDKLL